MAKSAITAKNLSKSFTKGVKRQCVNALKDLSFDIEQGEVFGFIGSNGAGKSTTIKILMGLLKPSHGQAWFFGQPITDPASRKRIGYLSENPRFYDYLTPKELMRLLGGIRGTAEEDIRRKTNKLLEMVELQDVADRKIGGFSKGMTQRFGIAAALFDDPDLLILDEPMSGLDPLGRHLVASLIRDLQDQGKTIFFSTHIIPDIETLCDRVGILVRGHQKYVGSIQEALYPKGNLFEITVRLPEQSHLAQTLIGQQNLLWRKDSLHKFEISETEISAIAQSVTGGGGSIVTLEPKRRSLEELFLELSGQEEQTAEGGME